MANIKKFAVKHTGELHLLDEKDNPMYGEYDAEGAPIQSSAMKAVLYGPASPQWQKAKADQNNRLMARLRKKGNQNQSALEQRQESATFLVAVTKELVNVDYPGEDGQMLQGDEKHMAVYMDPEIGYIADQCKAYVDDWANFSKPSAKS